MVWIYTVQQDTPVEAPVQSDPDSNIQEWRSEVNKRSNIQWEEKPDKVNLYSENIIQETENTETVDRDSIANLSTTRKQWETKTKPQENNNNKGKPKQQGQVRHWEVKLPTQLKKVPANVVRCTKDDSDSETEKMADTEYANESAIEREIRLATEREELLRKEQEERLKLQERQNASPNKVDMKDPFKDLEQNNNEKPTYHEMTEADRGSELQQREEWIQKEIQEQEAREAAIRGDNIYENQSQSSSDEDENANESIIEREIRLQREREMELEKQKNQKLNRKPVEEEVEEETVTVEYSEVVRTSPQSTPISTPDVLSETEDHPMTRQDARSRISYEEAIASGAHDGESLIARELREAREREEELQRMRKSMNGSVSRAPVQPETPKETVVVNKTADNVKPTYQKDVSPYKNDRRQSQDSLSSHSTEKSQNATPRAGKVTTFGNKVNQMAYRTPERKEKTNTKKVETPIEREIRLARERENEYRIAKGLEPLKDEVKVEEESEEEDKEELKFTRSSFFSHGPQTRDNSMQKLATSRLQKEINKQSQLEKKYQEEGKIKSTSEEHVGVVKYTDLAPAERVPQPKRNFNIARKSTSSLKSEPETKQNGTPEVKSSPVVPETRSSVKFGRSVSSGGVTFSYKESHHKAESKIEQELREMREREEELRSQRANAGLVSETGPESPRGQDKSVVSKRSQFEQTA